MKPGSMEAGAPELSPSSTSEAQSAWPVGSQSPRSFSLLPCVDRWAALDESRRCKTSSILESRRPLSSSLFCAADCFCSLQSCLWALQAVCLIPLLSWFGSWSFYKKSCVSKPCRFICTTGGFKSGYRKVSAAFQVLLQRIWILNSNSLFTMERRDKV